MPITDQGMSGKPGGDTGNPGVAVPPPPLKQPKGKKGEIKLTPPSKKLKDIVDISPQMEGKESHHVFTFGRMNPPTTGHEKLIHKTHARHAFCKSSFIRGPCADCCVRAALWANRRWRAF